MELDIKKENGILNIKVIGRLDTMTSPKLEEVINKNFDGINSVVFDFKELNYISSAGLRILVFSQKRISNMKILHPKGEVMEVLEVTGLSNIFKIEQ